MLLTLAHRRMPDRRTMLDMAAGSHAHLDILAARAAGEAPARFRDSRVRLEREHDRRLPG